MIKRWQKTNLIKLAMAKKKTCNLYHQPAESKKSLFQSPRIDGVKCHFEMNHQKYWKNIDEKKGRGY